MPDLEISGLDDRIRDLVARAVADAPPAPTIDEHTLEESAVLRPNTQTPSDRNRWIVGGIAGLSVAAAVIALIFVTRPDQPTAIVPATVPATIVPQTDAECPDDVRTLSVAVEAFFAANGRYPANEAELVSAQMIRAEFGTYDLAGDGPGLIRVAGVPCAAPNTTEPTDESGGEAAPVTAPPATSAPATAPVTTVTPAPPTPATDGTIAIATFDGIQLDTGAAVTDALLGYPAQTAQRVPDGRIFFQQRSLDPPGIFVYFNSDTAVSSFQLHADFTGQPVLHDAAVVNGEVVLLVESAPGELCTDPNTCIGSVWAIWPDRTADAAAKIDEQNVWEAGYSRLSLSATGVVVGMKSAEVSSSPWSVAIPGATASPIDPVALGLEVDYIDCSTCPTSLTIDSTGRYVGWIQPPTADSTNSFIFVKRLTDGFTLTNVIAESTELPLFASLDIGRFTDDGAAITDGGAIVNATDPADEQGSLVFDLVDAGAGNEPIVIGPLGTRMAFGA